jgi:hypothetical protein
MYFAGFVPMAAMNFHHRSHRTSALPLEVILHKGKRCQDLLRNNTWVAKWGANRLLTGYLNFLQVFVGLDISYSPGLKIGHPSKYDGF